MRIVSLRPLPLAYTFSADDPSRYLRGKRLNFLLVCAEAEDGTVGYGEVCDSFCCNYPSSVAAVLEEALVPQVVGKDLGNVDELVRNTRLATRRRLGDSGLAVQALSGVEIALWDLRGRLADQPICSSFGSSRMQVPLYASGSFLDEGGAEWHVGYFEPLLQRGVSAIKVRLGADYEPQLRTLRDLRRALGDGLRIMVDGNEFFTLDQALDIGKALADLNVSFFEEPIAQCEHEQIAALVEQSAVPIAYGEHLCLVSGFADCLHNRRAHCLQPDASICGGMSEGIRIGQLATDHGVRVAPHSAAGPVSLAANLLMAAGIKTIEAFEYSFPLCPMWRDTAGFSIDDIRDGHLALPQGAGLGVQLRGDLIRESCGQIVGVGL